MGSKTIIILAITLATSFARAEFLPLEFKVLVDTSTQTQVTLSKLKFSRVLAEHSYVYYYDTRDLKLFSAGLVIRSRSFPGAGGEVMVKAKPLEESDLDASWFDVPGLSCEIDAVPLKAQSSCSIRLPMPASSIDKVVTGHKPLDHILKPDQEFFANDFGGYDRVSARVRPLGPIESWRWRVPNSAGWRVMAEYWTLPSGASYIELSIKGLSMDHDKLEAALAKIISDTSVDRAPLTLNKTAATLKALSTPR